MFFQLSTKITPPDKVTGNPACHYPATFAFQTSPVSLRKLQPERIFDGVELLDSNQVLVADPSGKVIDILPADEAGEGIEKIRGWISPGLINCHCHLELSHLARQIPEKTGLPRFVEQVMSSRDAGAEIQWEAMRVNDAHMWQEGIQAVGDIANRTESIRILRETRLVYHHFIEVSGWMPGVASKRYQQARQNLEAFLQQTNRVSLVPHAPYSVSPDLWKLLVPHFSKQPVTIHNQESPAEQALFEKGEGDWPAFFKTWQIDHTHFQATGTSSLQAVFPYLASAGSLLLVHNTYTTSADIEFTNQRHSSVYWCLCPRANLYIENKLPPVDLLREKGCHLVLGTDSLASNHSLSILEEMKILSASFPTVPAEEILRWATSQGAKALQLEDELGRLTPGKRPGILQIEHLSSAGRFNQNTRITRWW